MAIAFRFIVVARDSGRKARDRIAAPRPHGDRRTASRSHPSSAPRTATSTWGSSAPGRAWTREALRDLLVESAGPRPELRDRSLDAFRNQPHDWQGVREPPRRSLAAAHRARASPTRRQLVRRPRGLSSRSGCRATRARRCARRCQPVARPGRRVAWWKHARPRRGTAEVLDAFMAQRTARNAASGLPWRRPSGAAPLPRPDGRRRRPRSRSTGCAAATVSWRRSGGIHGARRSVLRNADVLHGRGRRGPHEPRRAVLLAEVMRIDTARLAMHDLRPRHRRGPLQGDLLPRGGTVVRQPRGR